MLQRLLAVFLIAAFSGQARSAQEPAAVGRQPPPARADQDFKPCASLGFMRLPVALPIPLVNTPNLLAAGGPPPRTGQGWPVLQAASRMSSVVSWAESIYGRPRFFSVSRGPEVLVVVGSNWSGVGADDVFCFMRSSGVGGLPWKLIFARLQAVVYAPPKTSRSRPASGVVLDGQDDAVDLIDSHGATLLRIGTAKAARVLVR